MGIKWLGGLTDNEVISVKSVVHETVHPEQSHKKVDLYSRSVLY